jgi:uncharacterized protein (TIGR02117 family)
LNILKKILRCLAWFVVCFVLFVSTWLLAALALPLIPVNNHPSAGNDVTVFIQTNGDHTDIVVPVKNKIKDWSREISYQNTISKDTTGNYISLGWGDKGFYINTPTWSQLKFSTAFKAVFWLSTSAIHATFCKEPKVDSDCKKIMLNNADYARLINYIDNSFTRDAHGNVINIKTHAQYNTEDAFYDARGKYNLFYTCNTWANNALKACGQKACLWTAFDVGIFRMYK